MESAFCTCFIICEFGLDVDVFHAVSAIRDNHSDKTCRLTFCLADGILVFVAGAADFTKFI